MTNPLNMCGIDFIEFSSGAPEKLENLFWAFGFSKLTRNSEIEVSYFKQNDIHFFLNVSNDSYSGYFQQLHGPCISAMAWRFKNPEQAYQMALARGARAAEGDYPGVPAIYGIGESLIYFVGIDTHKNNYASLGFKSLSTPLIQKNKGFTAIDHLTNNVPHGTMLQWSNFYKDIFNFTEVRYFDIRGAKTGLTSYALRSPCGCFCIPINEAQESKSQINEYLEEYNGAGIQHLAFLTEDILASLKQLEGSTIKTLDIDDEYYQDIFKKFPQVTEDQTALKQNHVLIDGDDQGYLLQIFTKNLIGPIFIEIIQRKNHLSFGEGNFGALFRSIERDQMKRGYLNT